MTKHEREFLWALLHTPSPTGFEMPGQRVWAAEVAKTGASVECDSYGSTWAVWPGRSERTVMLEAHADEIGFMIVQVDDKGFLRLRPIGGSDAATARGKRLRVLGSKGEVAGVIGNTAIHLRRGETNDEKAPKVHELWVDVGASNRQQVAALGLRVGHPAVYADEPVELAHRRLAGRALDNRVGGFIIARVLAKVAAARRTPAFRLLCLNAVQEEIGGHGAMMAPHRLRPELCLCLDVTHATDTPGLEPAKHGSVTLGGGPTLTHGTANHPQLVDRLVQVADRARIPIQHEASSRATGTDTDKIFHTREGVPSALVSLPLRSMHSAVETADLDDVEHTIDLLAGFVLSLKLSDHFHHRL
jgi:endoglucanase